MGTFTEYSDCLFDAFSLHSKQQEIINRKYQIVQDVVDNYKIQHNSVLYLGFNPAALTPTKCQVFVSAVSPQVLAWLQKKNPAVQAAEDIGVKKYDVIVAMDEYLTFAQDDASQKKAIDQICAAANKLVITTVKDYKNQDFKEREYSQPAVIRQNNDLTAFTEIHDWHPSDKNSFHTMLYKVNGFDTKCFGIYPRRALFFKQLAKFSLDAGAKSFLIHKNIMYKSVIKKNYEHVISITF